MFSYKMHRKKNYRSKTFDNDPLIDPNPYILLIATIVPYANSLDPDETPSNLVSHPDLSCLTLRQYFHCFE